MRIVGRRASASPRRSSDLQERGLVLDIGHGTGSFGYETAEAMLGQGLLPDVISQRHPPDERAGADVRPADDALQVPQSRHEPAGRDRARHQPPGRGHASARARHAARPAARPMWRSSASKRATTPSTTPRWTRATAHKRLINTLTLWPATSCRGCPSCQCTPGRRGRSISVRARRCDGELPHPPAPSPARRGEAGTTNIAELVLTPPLLAGEGAGG